MSYWGLARLGGLAAMLGGLMWVVKGGGILLTDEQLPVVFAAAMPLFAVGLLGLNARLGGRGGPLGKVGVLVAYAGVASTVVAFMTSLTTFIVAAGFGPFLGVWCCWGATSYKPGSSPGPGASCRS